MKKFTILGWLTITVPSIWLGIIVGNLIPIPKAHAQVDTTIRAGFGVNLNINATKLVLTPGCSRAAGCVTTLVLCQIVNGVKSSNCLTLNGSASEGWTTLDLNIVEKTGTTVSNNQVGSLNVQIPANDLPIVP